MDEFLQALRTQGETESSGQFTLDVRKALAKLEEYRFSDKYQYILSLVASAVAGGATFVDVDWQPGALILSYDGRPLEMSELRDLYGSLFAQQTPATAHLRELAIGLHGGGRVHPERTVVSWDSERGRGVHLKARPEELLLTPLTVSPFDADIVNRVVMHFWGARPPELELVQAHFQHAPARVRVKGQLLGESRPYDVSLGLNWPDLRFNHEHQAPFRAVLHIPPEPEEGSALWVVHGLSLAAREPELADFGHLRIHADGLSKDLSQSRLVDDEAKYDLTVAVKRELWRALARVAQQLDELEEPWPERIRGMLLDLLVRRMPEPLAKGSLVEPSLWNPLWSAPWLPCAYGGKTSLAQMLAQMSRPQAPGYLPVTQEAFPFDDPPFHVLLETPAMRGPLRRLFRKVIYEW